MSGGAAKRDGGDEPLEPRTAAGKIGLAMRSLACDLGFHRGDRLTSGVGGECPRGMVRGRVSLRIGGR